MTYQDIAIKYGGDNAVARAFLERLTSQDEEMQLMKCCTMITPFLLRVIYEKGTCPRCLGCKWVCIHCDKALSKCQCPNNGARNPSLCSQCFPVPRRTETVVIDSHFPEVGEDVAVLKPDKPGYYWVRFTFGWEPARWDGDDWLRFGGEQSWNDDVREIGMDIRRPVQYTPTMPLLPPDVVPAEWPDGKPSESLDEIDRILLEAAATEDNPNREE